MSTPLSSLGKTRKVPLLSENGNSGRRGVKLYGNEDSVNVLSDGQDSEENFSIPSCYGGIGAPVGRQATGSHNEELLTMARKVQDLEERVKTQADQMLSKDERIQSLEQLVTILEEQKGKMSLQRQEELETACEQLRRQVQEMERFLGDYGLQWVGEPREHEDLSSSEDDEEWMIAKKFWKPADSVVPHEVDYDRLLASLRNLGELVEDGDTQVEPMPKGSQAHGLEPIPLKLYRNGIMIFDGPFRPFRDPSTQGCLRDILDGSFPAELQRLYPDGVPFKVSDLRNQVYPEDGLDPFPGEDRVTGMQRIRKAPLMEHTDSRMTPEKFLSRLPKLVIRQGEVIDIRGPIRDALQNCCPWPQPVQEVVVETPALAAERERSQEYPESPVPPFSMLRIKSENGEQAFLLMMQPEDTIRDVKALLAEARGMDPNAFEIFSAFPPKVYREDQLTLQEAGLVPNANLLLRPSRAPPPPANGPQHNPQPK
ncbi:UBX domain-containing protein 11 isoform X3 [Pipistrellus kuhlii]|uniref:UBX domain-containing protein 11 n=1 Tax=Pipistrellus kuhlii TaxID=59472 RepID=A0A7J8AC51_PIPKU|nr:UBX domain-containing protein 11 isoform X3 [Pipistrellus kuhlii]KAF6384092.1 UBX domain protein 11 [Pipistrellus kuhlii]